MLVVQKHLVSELSSCCAGPLSNDTHSEGQVGLCWESSQALRPEQSCSQSIFTWNAVETTWPDTFLFYPEGCEVCGCWWGLALYLCCGFPSHVVQSVCLCLSSSGRSSDFKAWLPVLVERAKLCVGFSKQDPRFFIQNNMTFVFFFLGSRC